MAHSGRLKHRDGISESRHFDEGEEAAADRVFRLTESERQQIAECLRAIDDVRTTLERQHNAEHRASIRTLRASADQVYDLLNELEEI